MTMTGSSMPASIPSPVAAIAAEYRKQIGSAESTRTSGEHLQRPFGETVQTSWLKDIKFGVPLLAWKKLGDVTAQQPRFRLEGTGELRTRTLVPETPAARQLLAAPGATGLEQALRGFLETLEDRAATSDIKGIALSTDRLGFGANAYIGIVDSRWHGEGPNAVFPPLPAKEDRNARLAQQLLLNLGNIHTNSGALAVATDGWISLGPAVSQELKDLAFGAVKDAALGQRVAYVMRHEGEHTFTQLEPDFVKSDKPVDTSGSWLEEGTADVLSRWPGAIERTAAAMGLPHEKLGIGSWDIAHGYFPLAKTFRGLVELAGIDTTKPENFHLADKLLQAGPGAEVPQRLAEAIIAAQKLPMSAPELAAKIKALDGKPELFEELRRELVPG